MNKPAGYKESPVLDEYHLDIAGPFQGGLWWYCVELEYDGVIYERQGVASTRGACFDAAWAYRAEVVAG